MHFMVSSLDQGTEWGIIFGLLKFQKNFGVLEIPDFFWGEWEMLGPNLRMKKR